VSELEHFATVHTSVGTVEIRFKPHTSLPLLLLDDLALPAEDWRKVAAAIVGAADYIEGKSKRGGS
jgi:hypothetical protein